MASQSLTLLETAALRAFASRGGADLEAIRAQVNICIVIDRVNTGVGFFSQLFVPFFTPKIKSKVLAGVGYEVEGLTNPMVFVLFMKDGLMDVLEGASIDDDTQTLDLLTAKPKDFI